MKIQDLEGDALDYMVQCCETGTKPLVSVAAWASENDYGYSPSTVWEQGGPIIEREGICVYEDQYHAVTGTHRWIAGMKLEAVQGTWYSEETGGDPAELRSEFPHSGKTPLQAAMRTYVASKMGPEVDIRNTPEPR